MATDTEQLVVQLEARIRDFEKNFAKANATAQRNWSQIEQRGRQASRRIETDMSKATGGLAAQFGRLKTIATGAFAGLGIERAASAIITMLGNVAKITDVAERVGMTAEQLQELRFALEQSGGSADDADSAMERFANNVAKAAQGSGYLKDLLAANGVALRDQAGQLRPTAALLADIANLIQNARSPQERMNIAVEAFGRSAGPAMVAALSKGAAGLRELGAEAQTTGAIISNDLVRAGAELDDQWQKVMATFSATTKSATINAITAIKQFFAENEKEILEFAQMLDQVMRSIPGINVIAGEGLEPFLRSRSQLARDAGIDDISRSSTLPEAPARTGRPTITPQRTGAGGAGRLDSFEREQQQTRRRIELMLAETATIGQGTFARARARIVIELETAAKQANAKAGKSNTDVTAEQRQAIDQLADAYANAATAAEQARERQQELQAGMRDFGSAMADAFKPGFYSWTR